MIVDSHQHFWDPARADYPWMTDDVAALRRRFGPEDLEPLLREHGVAGTVVVQARHSLGETRSLLAIAAETSFVLGVVGWIDLTADVDRQLRSLVYDLLVRTRELPAALATVERHPDVRFVLDHAGKAPRSDSDHHAWAEGVRALAELPNATCKLSGLFTEGDPAGTADRALAWFGPERCLFGSDWPVCLLASASAYADAIAVAGGDPEVLGETAIRTYGLDV